MIVKTFRPRKKGERKPKEVALGLQKDLNAADLPEFTFTSLPVKFRNEWNEIDQRPNPDACAFLKEFFDARETISVQRLNDITIAIEAGTCRISLRSQNKWENNTLFRFENMDIKVKMPNANTLLLSCRNRKPIDGEAENTEIDQVNPKRTYDQMSDEEIVEESARRGLEPYVPGPGGKTVKTNYRPRQNLIKELRADDAKNARASKGK